MKNAMKTAAVTAVTTVKGYAARATKHAFAYSRYGLSVCVVVLLCLGVYDRLLIRKQAQTLRAQQTQIQSQKAQIQSQKERFTRARHLMNESAEAKDKGERARSKQLRMNAQIALR